MPCAGNDTDEVKTVEDKMDHRSKRRLMNQVRIAGASCGGQATAP